MNTKEGVSVSMTTREIGLWTQTETDTQTETQTETEAETDTQTETETEIERCVKGERGVHDSEMSRSGKKCVDT